VLDGVLGNDTDLPIVEHATDTHGATLANLARFDLVDKQLSPGSVTWQDHSLPHRGPPTCSPSATRWPDRC
jgi:TnpA family transposase